MRMTVCVYVHSQGCRYNPPHPMEHEALAKRLKKLEYTVLFPDQTKQVTRDHN